jgi:hypothetical protein
MWVGSVCASGVAPSCAIFAAAGLFLTIAGSIKGGGNNGNNNQPINRDLANAQKYGHAVWYDLGNSTVLNYFDTSVLQHGIIHTLWDKGRVYSATRHPTGQNELTVHITPSEEKAASKKREEDVSSFTGVWNETGTVIEDSGQVCFPIRGFRLACC